MEDLLTPQICMDVDSTPLEANKNDASDDDNTSDTTEQEIDDDEKVKKLLELDFNDPAQVPDDLTEFEKEAKKNVFAIGEPAVQFQRLHCTACNVHLGSAPIGHFSRYIHPLLKVLLCKCCYEFYRSGDFDKDEDGSEMYCRWCGQGGKVMCCAQCAYVFCQKCVRQNLGRKTLELIKDSDDWKCFGCNSTQLINLKIICTSLFEFEQEEIRLAKALNNAERLKIDHSVCCQKSKAYAKRKRDEDATYNPNTDWEEQIRVAKKPAPSILKHTLTQPPLIEESPLVLNSQMRAWDSQDEDEVVCTPDLPSLMEDEEDKRMETPLTSAFIPPLTPIQKANANEPTNSKPMPSRFSMPTVQRQIRPEGPKKYCAISPKIIPGGNPTRQPLTLNNINNCTILLKNNIQPTLKPNSNFIRLQTPAVKFVTPNQLAGNRSVPSPIVNAHPAYIVPGLKHEWFERAATIISTITGNLSTTLVYLTKEQKNSKTVDQLATVHNRLQELLSTSVNSLIQVRKNLRYEFLNDLNKLKFMDGSNIAVANNKNNSINNNTNSTNWSNNKQVVEDDDVIVINSDSPSKSDIVPLAPVNDQPRPYLKVRSVSQLLTVPSECITIPDDPVPSTILIPPIIDDVVPFIEKDPLSLSPTSDNSPVLEPEIAIKEIDAEENTPKSSGNKSDEVIEVTTPDENSESSPTPLSRDELSGCDERTHLLIKNALAESKMDLLVQENSKYVTEDVPANELKKVLSVRVILAMKHSSKLPKHRLKTADWFTEDIEAILSGNILIRHSLPGGSGEDVAEDASATDNKGHETQVNEDFERVRKSPENDQEINDSFICGVATESAKIVQSDVNKDTSDIGNKDAHLSNSHEGIESDSK